MASPDEHPTVRRPRAAPTLRPAASQGPAAPTQGAAHANQDATQDAAQDAAQGATQDAARGVAEGQARAAGRRIEMPVHLPAGPTGPARRRTPGRAVAWFLVAFALAVAASAALVLVVVLLVLR